MKRFVKFAATAAVVASMVMGIASTSAAETGSNKAFPLVLTVTHGALVPGVASHALDLGQPGASVGDQVIIYAPLSKPAGYITGTLTTTAVNTPKVGRQIRQARLSFNFGSAAKDSLEVQGTTIYEVISPTLSVGTRTVRAVIGGTGRYVGASGYVVTTHPSVDKWIHAFHLRG